MRNAGLAQLGEHHVYTVEVGGSSPSARTILAQTSDFGRLPVGASPSSTGTKKDMATPFKPPTVGVLSHV